MSPAPDFAERYGPWALVTGASSGIGEGFARELAGLGFDLVLVARRSERLQALASELKKSSGRRREVEIETLALDLADAKSIEAIVSAVADKSLGLVINNAGDGAKGPFVEQPLASKLGLLDLNCRAPLMLLDALLPRLVAQGRGGVVITSSIESVRGFPLSSVYAATKAFESSLGEGLWGELAGTGVDLLVLEPGATNTEILARSGMSAEDMSGLMEPADVARQALARLGHGPVFIPGAMNRTLVRLLGWLPRGLAVRLAGKGMRDAIEQGRRRGLGAEAAPR